MCLHMFDLILTKAAPFIQPGSTLLLGDCVFSAGACFVSTPTVSIQLSD